MKLQKGGVLPYFNTKEDLTRKFTSRFDRASKYNIFQWFGKACLKLLSIKTHLESWSGSVIERKIHEKVRLCTMFTLRLRQWFNLIRMTKVKTVLERIQFFSEWFQKCQKSAKIVYRWKIDIPKSLQSDVQKWLIFRLLLRI